MTKDEWTELAAQVESHGPEKVVFFMFDEDEPLDIHDIRFEDNTILVELELS